eukprot:3284172-Prymnesium_polylepis.1
MEIWQPAAIEITMALGGTTSRISSNTTLMCCGLTASRTTSAPSTAAATCEGGSILGALSLRGRKDKVIWPWLRLELVGSRASSDARCCACTCRSTLSQSVSYARHWCRTRESCQRTAHRASSFLRRWLQPSYPRLSRRVFWRGRSSSRASSTRFHTVPTVYSYPTRFDHVQ